MGDEIWKDVPGYEGYYQVSSLGRVRSLDRVMVNETGPRIGMKRLRKGKVLKASSLPTGHKVVTFWKDKESKMFKVHVLVATAFHGKRPDDYHTHHINGDPTDNRPENLEYLHYVEHYRKHLSGRSPYRETKLKPNDVREIRRLLVAGQHTGKAIAKMFDVAPIAVYKIRDRRSWAHLD